MEPESAKLYQAGHKQTAVKLLAQKLQTDMTHADWFLQLASYLTAGGAEDQAEEILLRARTLFPQEQTILYNLAVIYDTTGQTQRAQTFLNQITDPRLQADVLYLRAQAQKKQNHPAQALAYALTAAEQKPHLADNQLLVADLLVQLHEFAQAQNYYQKAVQLQPTAASYFKLALTKMVQGTAGFQQDFATSQKLDPKYFQKHEQQVGEIERYLQTQMEGDSQNDS